MNHLNYMENLLNSVKPKPKKKKPIYRKSPALMELESMDFDFRYKDSVLPHQYRSRNKFQDNSANSLTKSILTYTKIKGCFSTRLNSTGLYRADLKKYIPSMQKKGLPDVLITLPDGRSVFCEVKYGKDKLSPHQLKVKQEIESRNGIYYIAQNFENFKQWFDNILNSYSIHIKN